MRRFEWKFRSGNNLNDADGLPGEQIAGQQAAKDLPKVVIVQTLIFTLLTIIYIGAAIEHHEH